MQSINRQGGEATMKNGAAAIVLFLSGCGTVQWVPAPEVVESTCTASCNAHYEQCPQVFARFPERGAVECPAEHDKCLKACENAKGPARTAAAPLAAPPPAAASPAATPLAPVAASSAPAAGSKEARLRELKHFYDEGLVTEDVYRDRQKAILSEP
jgi:hypothetical protein